MNLILMILRLVLSVLFPSRGDGLSLAARADGRMEHVPQSAWDWLLGGRSARRGQPRPTGPPARAADRTSRSPQAESLRSPQAESQPDRPAPPSPSGNG